MIIDCISDLHGFYPKLDGGDLLIVAGDLTARDTEKEWHEFASWMNDQDYQKIVFIAGNHDTMIEKWDKEQYEQGYKGPVSDPNDRIEYLCDSGTKFEGLKIWGSPWSLTFPGMNPKCMAFTEPYGCDQEEWLAEHWALIPDDIDILITHSPPFGILDWNADGKPCGSKSLFERSRKLKNLKLFVFGHIHEAYSIIDCKAMAQSLPMVLSDNKPPSLPIIVNASHVNERYQPVNKPIRVIL